MSYSYNGEASNQADFIVDMSASDENGADIDFTGSEISISIGEDRRSPVLTATVGDGITILDPPTTIELHFTAEQMQRLCSGSYNIGGLYRKNGITVQLLIGSVAIYDGVARL